MFRAQSPIHGLYCHDPDELVRTQKTWFEEELYAKLKRKNVNVYDLKDESIVPIVACPESVVTQPENESRAAEGIAGGCFVSLHFLACFKMQSDDIADGLSLDFTEVRGLTDSTVDLLWRLLPRSLGKLSLNFDDTSVSDAAFTSLSSNDLACLHELAIDVTRCKSISDRGLAAIAASFPSSLQVLTLDFRGCVNLTDACLEELDGKLPETLQTFYLSVALCEHITDKALAAIGKSFPAELKALTLSFYNCQHLTEAGVRMLAQGLPRSLRALHVNFMGCCLGDESVNSMCRNLPPTLKVLDLDFRSCHDGSGLRMSNLEQATQWSFVHERLKAFRQKKYK